MYVPPTRSAYSYSVAPAHPLCKGHERRGRLAARGPYKDVFTHSSHLEWLLPPVLASSSTCILPPPPNLFLRPDPLTTQLCYYYDISKIDVPDGPSYVIPTPRRTSPGPHNDPHPSPGSSIATTHFEANALSFDEVFVSYFGFQVASTNSEVLQSAHRQTRVCRASTRF